MKKFHQGNTNANSFWQMDASANQTPGNERIDLWNNSNGLSSLPFVITGIGNVGLSNTNPGRKAGCNG